MSEDLENSIDDINLDDFNFDDLIEEAGISDGNQEQNTSFNEMVDDTIDLDVNFDDTLTDDGLNQLSDEDVNNEIEGEKNEPFFENSFDEDLTVSLDENFSNSENITAEDTNFFEDESGVLMDENIGSDETYASELQSETVFENEVLDENVFDDNEIVEFTDNDTQSDDYSMNANVDALVEDEVGFETQDVVEDNYIVEQAGDDVDLPEGFFEDRPEESEIVQEEFSSNEVNDDVHNEYFDSGEEEIIAPALKEDFGHASDMGVLTSQNVGQLQWYSGNSDDKMFEISKGFESGTFDADEECKTIHVNVGYDTYGWEVQFSDGLVMNLRDVREYQIRNGKLPNSEGRIVFAQSALMFSGVERIVIYENTKYFSYGL
jgi:hypothetical protein